MPQECTRCKIVWSDSTLEAHSPQMGWVEENIEVCPKCKTDMDLVSSYNTNTYYMSFTGKIISDLTGIELKQEIVLPKRKEAINAYIEPKRRFSIADGSNCLFCEQKNPNHSTNCPQYKNIISSTLVAEYDSELKATIINKL